MLSPLSPSPSPPSPPSETDQPRLMAPHPHCNDSTPPSPPCVANCGKQTRSPAGSQNHPLLSLSAPVAPHTPSLYTHAVAPPLPCLAPNPPHTAHTHPAVTAPPDHQPQRSPIPHRPQ